MKIAVLMTCYNRVATSTRCLEALFACEVPKGASLDVYLVDDASPDGTGAAVKSKFPHVHVVQGSGSLYWCGGMRLAWKTARQSDAYDYYLWLNDDVVLFRNGILGLLADYDTRCVAGAGVVVGACCDPDTRVLTYGGRSERQMLEPSGVPQNCTYIHGNVVLVPRATYERVGGLSETFSHGFGDTDYGLRCIESGLTCLLSSAYVGACKQHGVKGPWLSSAVPIRVRLRLLSAPVGANFKEYLVFRKRHWPLRWILDGVKLLIQCVWPRPFELYSLLKGRFCKT